MTPYHYVSNNPINRIDPLGLTDYKVHKKSGRISQVGDANDNPDRILETDDNDNVIIKKKGFLVRESEIGKPKVLIDGIAKGILKDGMNLQEQRNVIRTGGKDEPTEQEVKNFLVKYSDEVARKEISGYSLVNREMKRVGYLVEAYKDNGWDYCISYRIRRLLDIGLVFPEFKSLSELMYTDFHFHVQPKHEPYYTEPSEEDRKAARDNRSAGHYIFFGSVTPSKNASESKY